MVSEKLKTGQDIHYEAGNDLNKIAHFERNYFSRGDIFANFMKWTERKLENFVTYVNAQPPGTEIPIRPMRMIGNGDRRAILFSPNLEVLITQRFPDLKVISVENIFEGR